MNKEQQFKNLFDFIIKNDICKVPQNYNEDSVFYFSFKKIFVEKLRDNFENIFGFELPQRTSVIFEIAKSYEYFIFGDFLNLVIRDEYFIFETNFFTIAVDSDRKNFYGYLKGENPIYYVYSNNELKELKFEQTITKKYNIIANAKDSKERIVNYNFPFCMNIERFKLENYKNLINMDGKKIDPFIIDFIEGVENKIIQYAYKTLNFNFDSKEFSQNYIKEIENKFGKEIKDFTEEDKFYYKMKYC